MRPKQCITQYVLLLSLIHAISTTEFGEIPDFFPDSEENAPTAPSIIDQLPKCICTQDLVIKNPHSGLVMEGTSPFVTLQHYTGTDAQRWRLEVAEGGQFHLINKCNGKVLDIDKWKPLGEGSGITNLVLRTKGVTSSCPEVADCQKWFIHRNGVIGNACEYKALEISHREFGAGKRLFTGEPRYLNYQIFKLQYV